MLARRKDRRKLGEKLLEAQKIDRDQLAELLDQQGQDTRHRYLGDLVVEKGLLTEQELQAFLPREIARQRDIALRQQNALSGTEAYLLQTALKFTFFSDVPIKTLLMTSAIPGEGKTLCANYLARTLATVNQARVLLLDADLVNPVLHKKYDVPQGPGWTDYLVNNGHTIEHFVSGTSLPNLYILPAGTIPPNPNVIFASQHMKDFIQELKNKFDLVIFDSSPVLPLSSSSVVLGAALDASMMVVKAGSTKKQLVKKALGLLEQSKITILGIVLNQVNDDSVTYYGYKHYPYPKA